MLSSLYVCIGKSVSEEQMVQLERHLHIDSMKKNPSINCESNAAIGLLDLREGGFVRRGEALNNFIVGFKNS